MNNFFSYPHRVQLHEIDGAGLLFYGELFRLTHNAYEEMLFSNNLPLHNIIQQRGEAIPLVHADADYHQPIKLGETLTLTIQVTAIGNHSFTLKTLTHGFDDGGKPQLKATVTTTHVTTSIDSGEKIPLPDALRDILQRYE
ncbi:MAG: acyl-CoA thioesterase [Gammaproteobacteria bacterium]|uniref:Acyl-CoA thioesterase n=1 Tax=Candidatus Thiopontia autotrophica TaxID=2841688 RepID=A0A8J6PDH7_9GAMM|nr:acyl-CoA thioesterase [Candidatus Thiopontia autotrophica]MBL6969019.1 acyl-CoA thioesterase [Gammaproteobacteria bacterium]